MMLITGMVELSCGSIGVRLARSERLLVPGRSLGEAMCCIGVADPC